MLPEVSQRVTSLLQNPSNPASKQASKYADKQARHPRANPQVGSNTASQETSPSSEAFRNQVSMFKSVTIIMTLAGISFLNTMGSGVLISALPRIADDIGLEEGFLLWPASVYALAAGCLLLIFGSIPDVVGAKLV